VRKKTRKDSGSSVRLLLDLAPSQLDALIGCARILAGRVDPGEELLADAYARLGPSARWYLRRTVTRLLARCPLTGGSPELALRFHLHHFFRTSAARARRTMSDARAWLPCGFGGSGLADGGFRRRIGSPVACRDLTLVI